MYDFHDTWEIDVSGSMRRSRLVVDRPWWAVVGEDYLFVPFTVAMIAIGCLGATLPGSAAFGLLSAGVGTLALVAGLHGVRQDYLLTRLELPASGESSRDRCRQAVIALGWAVVRDTRDFLVAATPATWFTWGRLIAIIYDKDGILVSSNAREGPGPIPRSPYAFGARTQSISKLEAKLLVATRLTSDHSSGTSSN